eukprot:g27776.t1
MWIAHCCNYKYRQNVKIEAGASHDFPAYAGLMGFRLWPKLRCNSDGNGCRIGQSGGKGQPCGTDGNWRCQANFGSTGRHGFGLHIDTKFEASFGGRRDYFDMSLVDGYTLPFKLKLRGCSVKGGTFWDCSGLRSDDSIEQLELCMAKVMADFRAQTEEVLMQHLDALDEVQQSQEFEVANLMAEALQQGVLGRCGCAVGVVEKPMPQNEIAQAQPPQSGKNRQVLKRNVSVLPGSPSEERPERPAKEDGDDSDSDSGRSTIAGEEQFELLELWRANEKQMRKMKRGSQAETESSMPFREEEDEYQEPPAHGWVLNPDGTPGRCTSMLTLARSTRIIRIVRLLRLVRMQEIIANVTERIQSEALGPVVQVTKVTVVLLTISHFTGCLWFAIGNRLEFLAGSTYQLILILLLGGVDAQYLASLHWALTQFSGGMDEIYPASPIERLFAVVIGLTIFVIALVLLGVFTSGLTQQYIIGGSGARQLATLKRYLKQNNVSKVITKRVCRNAKHAISGDLTPVARSRALFGPAEWLLGAVGDG